MSFPRWSRSILDTCTTRVTTTLGWFSNKTIQFWNLARQTVSAFCRCFSIKSPWEFLFFFFRHALRNESALFCCRHRRERPESLSTNGIAKYVIFYSLEHLTRLANSSSDGDARLSVSRFILSVCVSFYARWKKRLREKSFQMDISRDEHNWHYVDHVEKIQKNSLCT